MTRTVGAVATPTFPIASYGLGTVTLTTCPCPAGNPKPLFETYKFPSGPNVIAVGSDNPVAIVVTECRPLILTITPVPGVGNGFPVVFSST